MRRELRNTMGPVFEVWNLIASLIACAIADRFARA
jgi:hypothetical protein